VPRARRLREAARFSPRRAAPWCCTTPKSGQPLQDESGALVVYQPPIEQAQTISQMLTVIQHLQGELQSLRWNVQQLREDAEASAQAAAAASVEQLKCRLLESIQETRDLMLHR